MANYSKTNFVFRTGDNSCLKIRDITNTIIYTIYYNNSTIFFNNGNNLIIRVNGVVNDIVLDFCSKVEAVQALILLNSEYATIKANYTTKANADIVEQIGNITNGSIKTYVFSTDSDADAYITDNQTVFQLLLTTISVSSVYVNGVNIIDYTYNNTTKQVTLSLSYSLDVNDEVIFYYS